MPPPSVPGSQRVRQQAGWVARSGQRIARISIGLPVAAISAVVAIPRLTERIGQLLEPGGAVDSLTAAVRALEGLDKLVLPLERLADLQDELEALGHLQDELAQLGRLEDELQTIAGFEPLLLQLIEVTKPLPDLAQSAHNLPALVVEVRQVRTLVEKLDASFDQLVPMLGELTEFAGGLGEDVDELSDALLPISSIAEHLPGARRARRKAEKERARREAAEAAITPPTAPGDER